MLATAPQTDAVTPLVKSWLEKVKLAQDHKKPFDDTAAQCMAFFSGSLGFMWQPDFMRQFIGGNLLTPRFKVTVAKAFEVVALFGPTLYWQNPQRVVKPRKAININPTAIQALGNPQMQMMAQMFQQEQMRRQAENGVVSALLESWLNYTPMEQPGGGLATHAAQGITEALVKGRACLWPKPYRFPGSGRTITGAFFDSVDNLLIDPDATSIHDARWIAQRVVEPIWLCERNFNLPAGSLTGYGSHESAHRQGEGSNWDQWTETNRKVGKTYDLITYYKIYSKGGVGGRLIGPARLGPELTQALDTVVGDHAYICVAPNVPYPLNAPTERLRTSFDNDVSRMFQWPIAYWLDDKWPVSVLDFYTKPNSAWPIAPMAPGLGELTFINAMMSSLMNKIWNACRVIWAGQKNVNPLVETALMGGGDNIYCKLDNVEEVQKYLTAIQQPDVNMGVWEMLDRAMMLFDKRVGLSEILYSLNPGGVASRSAEDAANKRAFATIRTDYMANQVNNWMTEVADMEKYCARSFIGPQDLQGFYGPTEQMLWQQYIAGQDPELVCREFRATVAANSTRKPDKQRDVQNIEQMMQYFGQTISGWANGTGNPQPINGVMEMWGSAVDQDVSNVLLQPPPPPSPDPAAQQAAELQTQQMLQQLGMEREQHVQRMTQSSQEFAQTQQQQAQAAQLKLMLDAIAAKAKADAEKAKAQLQARTRAA